MIDIQSRISPINGHKSIYTLGGRGGTNLKLYCIAM